jgi:superfamily II DNA or RNA helicase
LMMVAAAIKLGYKTLIIAHQTELLDQFMKTLRKFTNYRDLREKYGRRNIAGICHSFEDFKRYDICLINYQHFIRKGSGERRLKAINKLFGTVIGDEAHRGAAKCYSRVMNNINARHKLACTGTIDRKDGLHFIVKEIVGPVKARSKVEMAIPSFEFVRTPVQTGRQFNHWVWYTKYLANHKARNKLIAEEAVKYAKQGRSVVIPITFVRHALTLVELINKKAGKDIAIAFVGRGNTKETRKKMLRVARSGKRRVFVGMRQLVQEGLDVPILSVLLEVISISNPPKFKQECDRIRTAFPGKPKPIIRMLCDDISTARGCMRTCYYQGALKRGFDISREDRARFEVYCKGGMPKIGGGKIGKRF